MICLLMSMVMVQKLGPDEEKGVFIDPFFLGEQMSIDDKVMNQVGEPATNIADQILDQVRNQVLHQICYDQVRNQVWYQVMDQVRSQVYEQVMDQVSDQVWEQICLQAENPQ